MERVVFHCDCNSFYASVELLNYPELRDKPVAVAGSEDNRHGIILAKNEPAKKFGVKTAETVWQARQKCPKLILLPPHHKEYRKFYSILNEIYASRTDLVEPFGIDESWLEMTGSWQLFGPSPQAVADALRGEVRSRTGLTISVGVSFNKVFAKLGSDIKKPDATTVISKENYQQVAWPLPVTAMLYIGEKARGVLSDIGVETIGQLAQTDEALLRQLLGKQGPVMRRYARGEDDDPVVPAGEAGPVKSVGNGLTFRRNLQGYRDIRVAVGDLADEVATRLRQNKLYASSVQVLIKNPDLKSISRQKPLPYATNLEQDLTRAAMELIAENWDLAKPIRMLTITAQNLSELPGASQISLFGDSTGPSARRERLEKSLDSIRGKYGRTAVRPAGVLQNDIGLPTGAEPEEE